MKGMIPQALSALNPVEELVDTELARRFRETSTALLSRRIAN